MSSKSYLALSLPLAPLTEMQWEFISNIKLENHHSLPKSGEVPAKAKHLQLSCTMQKKFQRLPRTLQSQA